MNTRKFKHNPAELLERGKAIIAEKTEYKFAYRVTMVNLLLAGKMTVSQLSEITNVPIRTLSTWVKKVDEEGFESLKAKKQPGRPNKLSDLQMAEIKDAVRTDPTIFGYNVWDGPSLSDFILKHFDIQMGIRQCQRLFRKLGFSLIRAQTFPSLDEQNEEERDQFKKTKRYSKTTGCSVGFSR